MSMAIFSPSFWLLSLLAGFLIGGSIGLGSIVWFVSIYWRADPRYVLWWLRAPVMAALVVLTGPALAFFIFRGFFGKYDFVLSNTLSNAVNELIIIRYNFFVSGAFLGLFGVLVLFFSAYVWRLWLRKAPAVSPANPGPPWPEGMAATHRH